MSEPTRESGGVQLYLGDYLEVMKTLPAGSVDAVVTDPPYGLEFMGKEWDKLARPKPGNLGGFADGNKPSFERVRSHLPAMQDWHYRWAVEALRVAKPGAHLLAFGGTRTHHRLMCAIEDAGWEIRDVIMWLYGSGFPKSLDVSKAIDKAAGVAMETRGHFPFTPADDAATPGAFRTNEERENPGCRKQPPATDAARQWSGWGTALKPAWEPIIVARKPLEGTVAENCLRYGTGALNIDGCRVEPTGESRERVGEASQERRYTNVGSTNFAAKPGVRGGASAGRWPANLIHDGSEEVLAGFPRQKSPGTYKSRTTSVPGAGGTMGKGWHDHGLHIGFGDSGSAARFFYCAKANRAERGGDNNHPTVKPVALMRYLCRLITPPGGIVLDPLMGSGSTGIAALKEGFRFVGIEFAPGYFEIAKKRIEEAQLQIRMPL